MRSLPLLFAVSLVPPLLAQGDRDGGPRTAEPASPATEHDGDVGGVRWWKGNLHTHSLWSDGDDFPEQIARWYREHDYDFLAFTEHNVLATAERWMKVDDIVRRGGRKALANYREKFGDAWVETRTGEDGKLEVRLKRLDEFRGRFEEPGSFLLVLAEEITDSFAKKPIHINATNLTALVKPQGGTSVARVIDRDLAAVEEQASGSGQPMFAHLNHPNFYFSITAEDLAAVLRERFFEVYNGHPGVNHLGDATHAGDERVWDIASTLRIDRYRAAPPFGLATDDSHSYFVQAPTSSNSGRGWVYVRAAELSSAALVEAIATGDFYASSGVELRVVEFDGHALEVEVAAVEGDSYAIEFVGTRIGYDQRATPVFAEDGKLVDATWSYSPDIGAVLAHVDGPRARYALRGDELYVRAVITSTATPHNPSFAGQRCQAWTQPVGWRGRVDAAPARFQDLQCPGEWSGALRGLAADPRGTIVWSFGSELVGSDTGGKLLFSAKTPEPLGDICLCGDEIFALTTGDAVRSGVRVFDLDRHQFTRRVELHEDLRGASAITWHAGRFHVVVRAGDAMRFVTLDDGFLPLASVEVDPAQRIEAGSLCFGDHRFWVGGADAQLLATDGAFAPWARVPLDVTHGIEALPAGLFLIGGSQPLEGGRFGGSAYLAEPSLSGGLQRRKE